MYNDFIENSKIDIALWKTADKYLMDGLVSVSTNYFKLNLSIENVVDVMIAAYQTNQDNLLKIAFNFAYENRDEIFKTNSWIDMKKNYPELLLKACC